MGLMACGDATVAEITEKQSHAVNAAVDNTCDRYAACGEIGTDKKYVNRNDCEVEERENWNDRWPVADCDGRIHGDNLQFCLDAIDTTSCDNFFDQLSTLSKCQKSDVCAGE